ncbi:MAG: hypothetical protein WA862_07960 [Solirubrobacterales bacterium]
MSGKLIGLVAAVLTMVSLIGASVASAATEFGDNCTATAVATESEPTTLFDLAASGNPLPVVAPSAGIITKWKINSGPSPISAQTLKVLRPNGVKTVQTVGEATQTPSAGQNTFDTRIPVQTGDRLALFTPTGFLVCETAEENLLGGFLGGGGGVGSTNPFVEVSTKARIPVSAVIEPDADNDGFGDETQDKCPQNATAQAACPVIALSASAIAKKGLATVLITSGTQAPVTVTGAVKLGKGKSANLNGGTQVVAPGAIARFTLLFPRSLRSKLKQLSPKRALTLNLTATAVNVTGQPSTTPLKVKLRGQAKPKHHAKKAKGKANSKGQA